MSKWISWNTFKDKKPDQGQEIVVTIPGSNIISKHCFGSCADGSYDDQAVWIEAPKDLNAEIEEAEKDVLALIRDNEDLLFLPLSGSGNVDIQCVKFKGCDYRTCAATDRLRLLYQEKRSGE